MPLWIPITVAAALFQCWRTAMQQKLRHLLSVNGAGFVRYLYGAPTALVLFIVALLITGLPVPAPNWRFLVYCIAGGLMQILATNLLIMSFGYRNFAVGTAYSKTETAQSAIVALIVLHEVLRPLAWVGICVGLVGVMTLSLAGRGMKPRELAAATVQPAALAGLGAGFLFAFTTVFIKLANQALSGPSLFVRALFALVVTNTLQTLMQGGFLAWREPRRIAQGVHHLAQFVLGRDAVGAGLGLLVHRLRAGRRGAGALGRPGGDRVHPAVQPLLSEGDAEAGRRRRADAGGHRRTDHRAQRLSDSLSSPRAVRPQAVTQPSHRAFDALRRLREADAQIAFAGITKGDTRRHCDIVFGDQALRQCQAVAQSLDTDERIERTIRLHVAYAVQARPAPHWSARGRSHNVRGTAAPHRYRAPLPSPHAG